MKIGRMFEKQKEFQSKVTCIEQSELPQDNINWASYHMLALMEEVGELLKSDKRWKTHRNEHYDKDNKLEELADCYITLMNIAIFSGITKEEFHDAIEIKMDKNFEKLNEAMKRRQSNE